MVINYFDLMGLCTEIPNLGSLDHNVFVYNLLFFWGNPCHI